MPSVSVTQRYSEPAVALPSTHSSHRVRLKKNPMVHKRVMVVAVQGASGFEQRNLIWCRSGCHDGRDYRLFGGPVFQAPLGLTWQFASAVGASMIARVVADAAIGAITAYAGGRGQIGHILSSAGERGLSGYNTPENAVMSVAKNVGSAAFDGWDPGPLGDSIDLPFINVRGMGNASVALSIRFRKA